eukprot:CAMPEP_0172551746 /NCGR_PEP_ID=MMETSP1067-20121228/40711_1 /TAXON_ID=265564 ORGANISM="Thalassiosira punctigera, Strain Tpunct2005C2" /NCGR_SAMPLE_ID=MMETSP1067 /ASSEMBLY_ACC=CAM_ASM_000444 /LENGTH=262 /DNA_ID=CAMNT_0013339577 /DNA_START=136 /DNA_END=924 /DNA_ORIENTATION=-
MVFSNICLILVVISGFCTAADGALSWGTFLGADWKVGEENMRNDMAVFIKNTQRICTKDVEKLCLAGRYVTAQTGAYTDWSGQYKRHMYKRWEDVPIGFGAASDECLHHELDQYQSGMAKRLIPKCVEWMEKTEGQFEKICKRERGNDKREAFVIFSTIFATAVSGVVGYMFGIFLKERDDLFSYHNRAENKKILIFFSVAISLPVCVILWASPRLLMLMVGAFGIGRGVQFYVQRRQDREYLSLPGSDSGLVFAAIPVQMD